jgi:hypothetical protein
MKGARAEENQVVVTPRPFLDAVGRRFGKLTWDLAANATNSVAGSSYYFGPGSQFGEDSLEADWAATTLYQENLWLNSPFSDRNQPMHKWMAKCAAEQKRIHSPILALIPAAVCTVWFRTWVAPNAYILELFPRVFSVEIRDCILAVFHPARFLGRAAWDWQRPNF